MIFSLAILFALVWPLSSWAISHNETDSNAENPGATTLALTAQNLAAGSLNIACFKWEGGVNLTSITDTAGNAYTLLTQQTHTGGEPQARCGYVLSATANAANVVTGNWGSNATFRRGAVFEFTYTGTAAADGEVGSTEATTDTTPSSNTLTTTGTEEVCIGFQADYTTQTFSGRTINGQAADGSVDMSGDTSMWYEIFSATFTNGASSLTRTVTGEWVQRLQCFKITGAGGGVSLRNLPLLGVAP